MCGLFTKTYDLPQKMFFYKLAFRPLLPLSVWYFDGIHLILKNAAFISLEVYKELKTKSKTYDTQKL